MVTLTHLHISYIIYRQLIRNNGIKLKWGAFAYGNIKPDFSNEDIKCEHYFDESIESVCRYSEDLVRESMTMKQFSTRLGVISHFLSDYFCLYHRDGYKQRGWIRHTWYEIKLHIRFLMLLLTGRLTTKQSHIYQSDLKAAVLKAISGYDSAKKNLSRDIIHSTSFAAQICERIILSCPSISIQDTNAIEKELELSHANGGSI